MTSQWLQFDIISGLLGFIIGLLSFVFIFGWRQHEEEKQKTEPVMSTSETAELLHWNPLEERRGIGDLVVKVNHIAITVSDVGKSLGFYVDILGLQQVRRPNFDRHGAWLTMGNIQLHLIKGIPTIAPNDHLQVGHIALETTRVDEVLHKLRELNVDVRQNLSVANAQKSYSKGKGKPNITQYFFNDPDGYFLELCNCEVLTEYSFGKDPVIDPIDYNEGIKKDNVFTVVQTASHWKRTCEKYCDEEFDTIMKTTPRATEIDENILNKLIERRSIYGDIMQGFSDEDIKEALLQTNNSVPLTIEVLTRQRGEYRFYQPPAYMENGELVKPESFFFQSK